MARYLRVVALFTLVQWHSALARDFRVRLLSGSERDGVWGTSEYSARINWLGLVRDLRVHGREVMPRVAALYTFPLSPDGKKSIRTVQGEGVGRRGLSIVPPKREMSERRGARIFRFRHQVAKPDVLRGETLCEVEQTVVLTPTGEISVSYDCKWTRTYRWTNFGVLIFYSTDTLRDCAFMGLCGDRVFTGRLTPNESKPLEARLREALEQLTVYSPEGPIHIVWDEPTKITFSWPKSFQLWIRPQRVPYRGTIYAGIRDRIAYRILLPVSQQ